MEHLEFIDKLDELGISIRHTGLNRSKIIDIPGLFDTKHLRVDDYDVKWVEKGVSQDPFKTLIKNAIDMGEWKHSWHMDIEPENYERILEIIQDMILQRGRQIERLLITYFKINKETAKQ